MTTLTIRHLGAEVPADLEQVGPARVERLLRLVADRALEERQATYGALTGEWFVRRLDLLVPLAADEPDSSAAARWAALIADSVGELVPDGSNVLHFRTRSRLLLDLVVGVTTGDLSRAWAWRQAGLLTAADPDPASRPGPALFIAFGREPRLAVPVLVRAVEQVGIRAVQATLGSAGWSGLAGLVRPGWRAMSATVRPSSIYERMQQRAAAVLAASTLASAVRSTLPAPDARTASAWAVLVLAEVDPTGGLELLAWVTAGLATTQASELSGGASESAPDVSEPAEPLACRMTVGRGPSRDPSPPVRRDIARPPSAPAVIGAQTIDPGTIDPGTIDPDMIGPDTIGPDTIGRSTTRQGSRSAGDRSAGATPGRPDHADVGAPRTNLDSDSPRPGALVASTTGRGVPPTDHADFSDEDTAQDPEAGCETSWAGLLFVLNAAAAAGIPDLIEIDARLAGRTLRWVLHQLALRLVPVAATDPAALALAGLTPTMPVPDGPPIEPVEEEALHHWAGEWAVAVGRVLELARHPEDDTPAPTLWSLARRRGWITADPGWLEVQLSVDDIDLLIRRAGLDLDPGWLCWLGTVVVFRYV